MVDTDTGVFAATALALAQATFFTMKLLTTCTFSTAKTSTACSHQTASRIFYILCFLEAKEKHPTPGGKNSTSSKHGSMHTKAVYLDVKLPTQRRRNSLSGSTMHRTQSTKPDLRKIKNRLFELSRNARS